jgi:hypothetical protein
MAMEQSTLLRRPAECGVRVCVGGGPDATADPWVCRLGGENGSERLGGRADFSYWQCYEGLDGPIAQLDRVTDFYSVGCRFESCWDRQRFQSDMRSILAKREYHSGGDQKDPNWNGTGGCQLPLLRTLKTNLSKTARDEIRRAVGYFIRV